MTDQRIQITIDGIPACTPEIAGDLLKLKAATVRTAIGRLGMEPDGHISGRPIYHTERLLTAMRNRPGRGANLRKITS